MEKDSQDLGRFLVLVGTLMITMLQGVEQQVQFLVHPVPVVTVASKKSLVAIMLVVKVLSTLIHENEPHNLLP